jgi:hypothetical protein
LRCSRRRLNKVLLPTFGLPVIATVYDIFLLVNDY